MARQLLQKQRMRGFLIFLVVAGLAYVFLRQKQNETPAATAQPVATQSVGPKSTPAPLTPAPRGQASKYNYMKRALEIAPVTSPNNRAPERKKARTHKQLLSLVPDCAKLDTDGR